MIKDLYCFNPKLFNKQLMKIAILTVGMFIWTSTYSTNGAYQNSTDLKQEISGKVTSSDGLPLIGATVIIVGTTTGVTTDLDGKYIISAEQGDVLEFSYLGMQTQQVRVGAESIINITLLENTSLLEEVVVTALGINKEKRRVGFATQQLEGEVLQIAQPPSFVEGLTGKIAGVIVTNNSSDFFSDPQIYLRGERPLIVVDGVPQPNSDFWNLASDDIESITVLKGAAASALYGSLGKDGAIEITMKTGKGQEGTVISYNTSNTFQTGFLRIPRAQTEYGPGNNGIYRYGGGFAGGDGLTLGGGQNDVDHSIWGPRFDGRLIEQFDSPIDPETGYRIPTPWVSRGEDNLKNFMEAGLVSTHNVTVQSNFDRGYFAISDTYRHSKASTPGQKLDINTIRLAGHMDITNKFSIDASLQFNHQNSNNRIRGTYGPTSPIYNLTIWGGAHYDIRDFRQVWEEGKVGISQNKRYGRLARMPVQYNGHMDITNKFSIDASLQFNHQNSNNRIRGTYGPTSPIYNLTIWGGAHYDIRDFRQVWEEGKVGISLMRISC